MYLIDNNYSIAVTRAYENNDTLPNTSDIIIFLWEIDYCDQNKDTLQTDVRFLYFLFTFCRGLVHSFDYFIRHGG